MDLSGKVALVTGSGRGIGRATALALARAGADVVVNYLHNSEAANEVVRMIEGLGRRSFAVEADVGNRLALEILFGKLDETFGKLDILVNNAGTATLKRLEDISLDLWESVLRVRSSVSRQRPRG